MKQAPDSSAPQSDATPAPTTVRVWDLPLRLFHWALALAVLQELEPTWLSSFHAIH